MPGYFERLVDYYQAFGIDCVMIGGVHWIVDSRAIVPMGPACQDFSISADQERSLLDRFRQAFLVMYTDGFQPADACDRWYAVTCRRFLDLGDYNAHFRSMIRRGLKHCSVRQVDAEYIAAHGFGAYMAAYSRYQNTGLPNVTEATWSRRILLNKDYPDLRHYWAVFVDDRLIGYSANWLYDTTQISYSQIKIDPQFLSAYPSYALFFTMNEYYLRQQSFTYVSDGFKNIGHTTGVQDFLIQKFGFQKTPTNLYVRYRPWVAAILSMPRLGRRMLGKCSRNYAALCAIDDARTHRFRPAAGAL